MKILRRLWFWLRRRQIDVDLEEKVRQHREWIDFVSDPALTSLFCQNLPK